MITDYAVPTVRILLSKGSSFHVDHDYGTGEPTSRDALDNCVHEIEVVTDC